MHLVLLLSVSASLGACAATKVESNKAADYSGEPKRVYVLFNDPNVAQLGSNFVTSFRGGLSSAAAACGAVLELGQVSPLALDDSQYEKDIQAFGADSVLVVKANGGTLDELGQRIEAIYDVRLIDVQTRKTVWRANANLMSGGIMTASTTKGESLSAAITDKMKNDGLLRNCTAQAPQK